ncbi:MAG: hypothetical protein EA409_08810 [Saprospirales bacterium]|nr:MAG: hypothetical protein EA409_08810 [Saprospirales bacterium]
MKTNRYWYFSGLLICVIYLIGSVQYYGMHKQLLKDGGDGWGYYIYLPSAFISGDLTTLEHVFDKRKEVSPHTIDYNINHMGASEVYIAPNGNPVIKYTSGVAIMMSPFFLTAHIITKVTGGQADGFGDIYWFSIYIGVIFWVTMGLILLFKTLSRYLNQDSAFLTLGLIALGTNLYYFSVYNAGMSHAPLFALYCILIYFSDKFYLSPGKFPAIIIGLAAGLITMIRPVELICVLIPLLWSFDGFHHRLKKLWNLRIYLLLAAIAFFISVFPQLLYWKITTGDWLYYSYGDEGFNFLKSRIKKGLLGYQNGWLVYTPLMFLVFPGLWIMFKKRSRLLFPITLFMILHIYIVYSWHNWYYINSFGSRPMVETYALMAFPLGYFIQWLSKSWRKIILVVLSVFFVLLNQLQTWQVSQGMLLSEQGNSAYYWELFGRTKMTEKILIAADTGVRQPEIGKLDSVSLLFEYAIAGDIEVEETGELYQVLPAYTDIKLEAALKDLNVKPGDYIRVSVEALSRGWNSDRWGMATVTAYIEKDGDQTVRVWNRINNKLGNPTWNLWGTTPDVWGEAWFYFEVPKSFDSTDVLHVFVENRGHVDIYVRSLKVEHWVKEI